MQLKEVVLPQQERQFRLQLMKCQQLQTQRMQQFVLLVRLVLEQLQVLAQLIGTLQLQVEVHLL